MTQDEHRRQVGNDRFFLFVITLLIILSITISISLQQDRIEQKIDHLATELGYTKGELDK